MIKLTSQSELNSPTEYDRIFAERQKKGVDEHDMRRWKRLLKYYNGGNLVDLGCLDSEISVLAKKKCPGAFVYGIDIAEKSIVEMQKKYPNISFAVGNLYDLKHKTSANQEFLEVDVFDIPRIIGCPDMFFDYAVMGEVLEHLEHPEDAIKEAIRILKPKGILAISVPLEEARELGAVDRERHLWSFSKQDIRELLEPYGRVKFDTVGSLFTWKPPFYRYCWKSLIAYCWKK